MGSRHNRKRTRSRPRNRNRSLHSQSLSFDSMSTPPPLPQPLPTQASFRSSTAAGSPWTPSSYSAWNDGIWLRHQQMDASSTPLTGGHTHPPAAAATQAHRHVKPADDKHLRVFGGEPEDGMALCDSMVQVLLDLFDGSVDYEDDDVAIAVG